MPVNLDDINLNASDAENMKNLGIDPDNPGAAGDPPPADPPKDPDPKDPPPADPPKDPDPKDPPPAEPTEAEKLVAQKAALEEKLATMSISQRASSARLQRLEAAIQAQPAAPPAPAEPTEEEKLRGVLEEKNAKLAETDVAIEELESDINHDPKALAKLRRDLRGLERETTSLENKLQLSVNAAKIPDPNATVDEAVRRIRYNETLANVRNEFPELDTASDDLDNSFVANVKAIYEPFLASGMDPSAALQEATNLAALKSGIVPLSERNAKSAADEAAAAAAAGGKSAEAQKREAEQLAKNLEAAKNTPPNVPNTPKKADDEASFSNMNFAEMSVDDFMNIPDKDLAAFERSMFKD